MIYDEIPNNENHELHEKDCDVCGMCLKVSSEKSSEHYVFSKIYFNYLFKYSNQVDDEGCRHLSEAFREWKHLISITFNLSWYKINYF